MIANHHLVDYYVDQAKSGIQQGGGIYAGNKYQKGYGFFSRIMSSAIMPLLKYLGKRALSTGITVGSDVIAGTNIKDSLKKRLESSGFDIAEDVFEKMKNLRQQRGSGRRRKKNTRKKKLNKKQRTKGKPSLLQLQALAKGRRLLARKRKYRK